MKAIFYIIHDGMLFSNANSLTAFRNAITPSASTAAAPMSDYDNIMNDLIRARRKLLLNRSKFLQKIHTKMSTAPTGDGGDNGEIDEMGETIDNLTDQSSTNGEEISDLISRSVAHFLIVPPMTKRTNVTPIAKMTTTTSSTQSSLAEENNINVGNTENFTAMACPTAPSFQKEFASAASMRDYLASW